MAKLRGSKTTDINSIAEALRLALKASDNEKELRQMIGWVIKNIRSRAKKNK